MDGHIQDVARDPALAETTPEVFGMTESLASGVAHPAIDGEFKGLIPPLAPEERAQLEANVIAEGCRDPLVVWQEKGVLLDGHNRLEICKRHGIEYRVERMRFESREAAFNWIINNQLGRRNLHPDQASYLRGKRYQAEKKAHGGDRSSYQNDNLKTNERLAEEYKVSPATIARDGKYADAVDALADAGIPAHQVVAHETKSAVVEFAGMVDRAEPELIGAAARGEVTLSTAAVIATAPPETQRYAAENPKEAQAIAHNHRAQGTGENEWYTPAEYLDAARAVLGSIDLDPASSPLANETVGAARIFTVEDDGLSREWGGSVWMNPPYSQPAIAQFSEKLASEFEAGNVNAAIALTHNYTDTAWFHRMASVCNAICFTRGRIGFVNPEGKKAAPTQGQAFFYFGSDVDAFASQFSEIGLVVEVRHGL